jgi:hypothetical protein
MAALGPLPWGAVTGACLLGAVILGAAITQPGTDLAWHLLRLALTALAAAAAFVLDEAAAAAVDATPRSPGRRTAQRLPGTLVPGTVWLAGIAVLEHRDQTTPAVGLLLEGVGALSFAVAVAACLRRAGWATPGETASTAVAVVLVALMAFDPLPGTVPVFPTVTHWQASGLLWLAVAAAASATIVATSRQQRR